MKSNYFLISIDDSGLEYKGNIGDKNVYTYNLSEVIIDYQIILSGNNYIIGPNNMNIPVILHEVDEIK